MEKLTPIPVPLRHADCGGIFMWVDPREPVVDVPLGTVCQQCGTIFRSWTDLANVQDIVAKE